MGEMKRVIAREKADRQVDRFASTIAICASIICAIRLAREPDITRPTPRLYSEIADSISLAKMILDRIVK
jgi:hypothetical protein